MTVHVDRDQDKLRFDINGEEFGWAFEDCGFAGMDLYFAVTLRDGEKVEIIDGE
jgi:hypothetical protein